MAKPKLPPELDLYARLSRAQADLADAKRLHSFAALKLAHGDETVADEVKALEEEIATHERSIARTQAAIEASAHVATETDRADARRLQGERLARIEALNGEVLKALDALIAHLRGLPGLLTQLEAVEQERDTLFALLGHGQMRSRIGAQTSASTVLAALQSSGIGVIGPRLAQRVVIDRAHAVAPEVAAEHYRSKLDKELRELRELINPKVVETTTTTADEEAAQ